MVATRASGPGLSPTDLERIRDTLATGRKPRVTFTKTAGQIAGQIGQVVALTDPDLSDEWVVVRFGRDKLPFAPADLAVAPRAAAKKIVTPVPAPREEPTTMPPPAQTPADDPGERPAPPPTPPAPTAPTPTAPPVAAAPRPVPAPATESATAKPPAARKTARPKPTPSLTVTLTYADGEWMVAASQGAKSLAKPYIVRPSEALRMVSMLDVPGVHEAVEEIVEAARAQAQTQADRLRAELAEVEARLADLRTEP